MQPLLTSTDVRIPVGRYRWRICALLFFATTINYLDRQVLGLLAPQLQEALGWSELDYGRIVTAFQAAYALGFLGMGTLMDRLGTRLGYAVAVGIWSLAAMAHALARNALGFSFARFALGLGEAGNFPAALKTVAEWFPKRERALAVGIFNAGANVGAIVAPLTVPYIALTWGWPWAFLLTGALGLLWLGFWWQSYRPPADHPRLTSPELAYIRQDPPDPAVRVSWRQLAGERRAWAFALAKFLTDPVWWFYLYWLPKFLFETHGLTLDQIGWPLVVIYVVSDLGSIAGGWFSSFLLHRGWSVNAARKLTLLLCALAVLPIGLVARTDDLWTAVALISLATAAHQAWSANLFTLTTDLFPRPAVGSVVGMGGMAGAIGGMGVATAAGWILETTGSYFWLFGAASLAYLIGLALIQLCVPTVPPQPRPLPFNP
ncbi:MFS transporter, ACS family, hexuronate transporter [Catalinimonas alkaloidigena]|uniref:MFS transporter, ACS family, hexuronate transporter n=1 Tax=Catalinimonas alkaloidigena TaxID=1075417 RepID=A0A1G8Y3G0_9BACT|nr:MFS transporter [Catalinimonas alkaloidigena]SDJ97378.1 MFS transporter, ACS family, hexuronate transporter [Catalinimonas alkaloidigena]